jgi:immunoglobulin-like protein involved in spore germination
MTWKDWATVGLVTVLCVGASLVILRCTMPPPAPVPTPTPEAKFKRGDKVWVVGGQANVRVEPAPSAQRKGTQHVEARGVIDGSAPITNGGYTWWLVDFASGADGWVIEARLAIAPAPTPDFNGIPGLIEVFTPKKNAVVCADGQVTVTGRARGYWYFEASFPLEIRDVQGQPIGTSHAEAQDNWQTTNWVPFKGVIKFREPQGLNGSIVFHNDNPSGLPENDKEYVMPVRFQLAEQCARTFGAAQ